MILQNLSFLDSVSAPPSKSETIRAAICAALSSTPTFLSVTDPCEDILTVFRCLPCLGAEAIRREDGYDIFPRTLAPEHPGFLPDFGECAAALRLMYPIAGCLHPGFACKASERLQERVRGTLPDLKALRDGCLCIDASETSQTVSGLMIAVSVLGGSFRLSGPAVSAPYLAMTHAVLRRFGGRGAWNGSVFSCDAPGPLTSPGQYRPEGDWSGAAYPMLAGILGPSPVTVTGLSFPSLQGDAAILSILRRMGARVEEQNGAFTAYPSALCEVITDASDCPDLIPVLAAAACAASGNSVIRGAQRLRRKESDRTEEILRAVTALGGNAASDGEYLHISGPLRGGTLPASDDHRIAMMGVLLALAAREPVVCGPMDCVKKSYPAFPDIFWSTT